MPGARVDSGDRIGRSKSEDMVVTAVERDEDGGFGAYLVVLLAAMLEWK